MIEQLINMLRHDGDRFVGMFMTAPTAGIPDTPTSITTVHNQIAPFVRAIHISFSMLHGLTLSMVDAR